MVGLSLKAHAQQTLSTNQSEPVPQVMSREREAVDLQAGRAESSKTREANLKVFPKRKKLYELFLRREAESSENEASSQAMAAMFQSMQPVAQKLHSLGISADEDHSQDRGENVLTMPEIEAQR